MKSALYLASVICLLTSLACKETRSEKVDITSNEISDTTLNVQKDSLKLDTIFYHLKSVEEALELFNELNYTSEDWKNGVREIPSLYITKISSNWRNKTSKEITTRLKKQIFFRVIAPLALHANDLILKDRIRIENARKGDVNSGTVEWLHQMGNDYKIQASFEKSTNDFYEELLMKVDILPLSLILAQSAEESGWGTSRFASEGNALFGQWAWGDKAMKPTEQRPGMGNYGIAKFETPQESMIAYLHNLNSHKAYNGLRERRAQLRQEGKMISGKELANTLLHYSERGQDYVDELQSLMRYNHLEQTDSAYLKRNPVIILLPSDKD